MRYNSKCTVWHKENNSFTAYHYPCWWQDTEAVNIDRTGSTNVNSALIHIPIDAVISKEDYIAHGEINFTFDSVSELLKAHAPLKVTTVSRKSYGSGFMQHTEVTAK